MRPAAISKIEIERRANQARVIVNTGKPGIIIGKRGVGIVKSTKHLDNAKLLVEFLVAQAGQKLFADLNKEYPLHTGVKTDPALAERKTFRAALVPLTKLAELREPTLTLIEQVGLR